jgi:hypothetical protein
MAKLHPRSAAVTKLLLVTNSSPVFLARIYFPSILAPLVDRRKPLCSVASEKMPPLFAWQADMSAFCHKADMSGSGLLLCKLSPEPHFARRKSLL